MQIFRKIANKVRVGNRIANLCKKRNQDMDLHDDENPVHFYEEQDETIDYALHICSQQCPDAKASALIMKQYLGLEKNKNQFFVLPSDKESIKNLCRSVTGKHIAISINGYTSDPDFKKGLQQIQKALKEKRLTIYVCDRNPESIKRVEEIFGKGTVKNKPHDSQEQLVSSEIAFNMCDQEIKKQIKNPLIFGAMILAKMIYMHQENNSYIVKMNKGLRDTAREYLLSHARGSLDIKDLEQFKKDMNDYDYQLVLEHIIANYLQHILSEIPDLNGVTCEGQENVTSELIKNREEIIRSIRKAYAKAVKINNNEEFSHVFGTTILEGEFKQRFPKGLVITEMELDSTTGSAGASALPFMMLVKQYQVPAVIAFKKESGTEAIKGVSLRTDIKDENKVYEFMKDFFEEPSKCTFGGSGGVFGGKSIRGFEPDYHSKMLEYQTGLAKVVQDRQSSHAVGSGSWVDIVNSHRVQDTFQSHNCEKPCDTSSPSCQVGC